MSVLRWPFTRRPLERGPERQYVWHGAWGSEGISTVVWMTPGVQLQSFRIETVGGRQQLTVMAFGHPDKFGLGWLPLEQAVAAGTCAHCRERLSKDDHAAGRICPKCCGPLCVHCPEPT